MNEEQSSPGTWKIRQGNPEAYFIRRIEETKPEDGLSEEIQVAIQAGQAIGIRLANNKGIAVIDAEDYDLCCHDKWHWYPGGYASRWSKRKPARLHRLVMRALPGQKLQVDHIQGKTFDCRKSKLRWATNRQNCWNCSQRNPNRISRYCGVTPYVSRIGQVVKRLGWKAQFRAINGITRSVLTVKEETAAMAYDVLAMERGEFARLNFPYLKPDYLSGRITIEMLSEEYKPAERICTVCGKPFSPPRIDSTKCSPRCHQLEADEKYKRLRRESLNFRDKMNMGKHGHKTFSSKFMGVCKVGDHIKVVLQKGGKIYRMTGFDSEEQAAQAFDIKALELYGDSANLNFPELWQDYRNGLITIDKLSEPQMQSCLSCGMDTGAIRAHARKICRKCYNKNYQKHLREKTII